MCLVTVLDEVHLVAALMCLVWCFFSFDEWIDVHSEKERLRALGSALTQSERHNKKKELVRSLTPTHSLLSFTVLLSYTCVDLLTRFRCLYVSLFKGRQCVGVCSVHVDVLMC